MMEGWKNTRLGELVQLVYGKPLAPEDRDPNGLYPAYGANGEKTRTNKFYCDSHSIIIGRKGSAGEITLTEEKFWPLDVTYFIEFDRTQNDFRFIYYLLSTLNLPSLAKGVKPGINREEVYALPVSVPALNEQRRIVAILDEAFEAIATAKANTEKNRLNAEELGLAMEEACLARCAAREGKPKQLADLCELIVDCEHKTAPTQETGYPSIRTPNIGRGELILNGVNRVSEETYKAWTRRAIPQAGDLILAREAPAGNVAVIPPGLQVCLGQRTVLIRPKASIFKSRYLAHLLLQRASQERLLAHSRGATVQHVNMKDIRVFQISRIPSLTVQRQVLEELGSLHRQSSALMQVQLGKLTALDELKKSLLHQAFTGQLTAWAADRQLAAVG
ncbi:MAG: restriction endonuclease subunit S [Rhodocyclaceae bacterium]|nr:MAG: restriction endonuclease subunit S [Rhodocyclaceae bacterium]